MSASLEYTEWHLTAIGWVRGTMKTDSAYEPKEPPMDVLTTFVYSEEISYSGPMDERVVKRWARSASENAIAHAIELHGECPRSL